MPTRTKKRLDVTRAWRSRSTPQASIRGALGAGGERGRIVVDEIGAVPVALEHRSDLVDDLDAIGGVDFGEDLVADAGLSGGVGEKGRVEQRDLGRGDVLRRAAGRALP